MPWKALKDFILFIFNSISETLSPPFRTHEIIKELERLIHQAIPIVLLCLSFAVMVTILESSYHMQLVIGDDSLVPGFASVLILRELSSVITALLLIARSGASIAAEMATQKITDQIDAFKMLGIRPIQLLVAPKIWAFLLGAPLLTALANICCLIIAILVSYVFIGTSMESFFVGFWRFAQPIDLVFSLIKAMVFGCAIPILCGFFAFRCRGGAKEVGLVTTRSVVSGSVFVITADFLLTSFFSYFY